MIIRPAAPGDNEALCRMELLAPQGTAVRLTEQRFDFFARARQLPGAILAVAADDESGRLAGVLGGAPVRVRIGGSERLGGLLFDLRANPEYQRGMSRILYLLWQEVERQLRAAGVEFMYGMVKADNPATSIYYRLGTKKRSRRTFWTLPVYRRRPAPAGVEIRSSIAAAADYHAAADWYRGYDLWPLLTDPEILQPLADRYVRAELAYMGATAKLWDGGPDYERVVAALPRIYDLLRPLARAVGRVVPVPQIPHVGKPLRSWILYDVRVRPGTPALGALVAAANNLALAEGIDFLVTSAAPGEPELAPAGRGALFALDYHFLIKEYEPVPELSPRVYFDIRMT